MAAPATSPQPTDRAGRHRLWFHLDDVLPLAAHAASTPRQALTREQLTAHAPSLPALIWARTGDADTLASNGDPGWYDPDGDPHRVRSRSWVRPGSRRPEPTGPAGGYLPLRSVPGLGIQVIDWLREAAVAGCHWLSIDITRARPVIGADRLDVVEQRGDLYPPDVTWLPAAVACVPTTGSGTYPALVADGYRNTLGGEIARFDTHTVAHMILDLAAAQAADGHQPGPRPVLRWSGDRVEVFEQHDLGGIPALRRYDVIGPDADGHYPVGAHLWPWLRTDMHMPAGAA
ncbi:hypothetical protein [Paractinoplanes toevensis]|uniref:Uncharacterized protein n=1 Tax=Paractinoplanes toevensis TaxID=571911 RepID=A0A919W336_9ACTN|nr:hypothetical protein [Actinoplanes toevensis]GIM90125.1 hypothetical protein Ato02nite_019180 [Actinoplanes toevensis]